MGTSSNLSSSASSLFSFFIPSYEDEPPASSLGVNQQRQYAEEQQGNSQKTTSFVTRSQPSFFQNLSPTISFSNIYTAVDLHIDDPELDPILEQSSSVIPHIPKVSSNLSAIPLMKMNATFQTALRGDKDDVIELSLVESQRLLTFRTIEGMSVMHVAAKNKKISFILFLCKQLGMKDCLLCPHYSPSSQVKKTTLYYLLDAMTENNVLQEEINELDSFFTFYAEELFSILSPFLTAENQSTSWLPDNYFDILLPVLAVQADIFMEFNKEARFLGYFNLLKQKINFLDPFLQDPIFQRRWDMQLDMVESYVTEFAYDRKNIWKIRERLLSMLAMEQVSILYDYIVENINYEHEENPYFEIQKRSFAILAHIIILKSKSDRLPFSPTS